MKVKDIMSSPVEEIRSDATISQAARMMQMSDIGVLPIMKDGDVVGVLTDRDIAIRVVAEGLDPQETSVSEVMSSEIICCSEDSSMEDAATLMEENQVHRLLVLSGANRVSGIISIADIVRRISDDHLIHEILESICQPAHA
jgi:CBS domain-containing protein